MGNAENFILGVNWWPREKALYYWREFEPSLARRDFAVMAEYRFDLARIFLLWEDFQPEEKRVSVRALEALVRVADMAHDHRIKVLPVFFCGHLYGVNWVPPWLMEAARGEGEYPLFFQGMIRQGRVRNMYADREVWKAQKLQIHEATDALQGHPAVFGWDLGNRPSNLFPPPSRDSARAWLEEMVGEIKRRNSSLPVTLAIGQEDLEEARGPGPGELAPYVDFVSLQVAPGRAKGLGGPGDERGPLFLGLLTRWLTGKEVLLGDIGIPTAPSISSLAPEDRQGAGRAGLAEENEAADFYVRSLGRLKAKGIKGALVGSFGDADSSLWDKPPFDRRVAERFGGLFRTDGSAKPAAREIRGFSREGGSREVEEGWLDIRPDEFHEDPRGQIIRLYRRFKERA